MRIRFRHTLAASVAVVALGGFAFITANGRINVSEQLTSVALSQPHPGLTVHTLQLGVSNAFLLETADSLILIDAGLPGFAPAIEAYIRELGDQELDLIYITHAHIDHYGSAAELRRRTGAPIAIHKDDAATMAGGDTKLGMVRDWKRLSDTTLPAVERMLKVEPTTPDFEVEEGWSLAPYGLEAHVLHTPGHTPGSSTVFAAPDVAFVGDLLSGTGTPHIQRSYAQDWKAVNASLERLQALNPAVVYSGHGMDPITNAELMAITPAFAANPQ